jgi:hypothetical protein
MCVDRDGKGGNEEKNKKEGRADYTSWCSQHAQSSVLLTMYSLSKNFFFYEFIFVTIQRSVYPRHCFLAFYAYVLNRFEVLTAVTGEPG